MNKQERLRLYRNRLNRQNEGMPKLHGFEPKLRSRWYVHGHVNGVPYTRGGYDSEGEARAAAYAMFPVGTEWEATQLPTVSLIRAKAIFRDKDLQGGMSLGQAMQPHHTATKPIRGE